MPWGRFTNHDAPSQHKNGGSPGLRFWGEKCLKIFLGQFLFFGDL